MPGVPTTAFVNDIKADKYDANTVYVVLDNHKYGDYQPYLLKSVDKGRTWQSMKGNLPDRTLLWRIVQDHERSDLFFLATEFGIYFTLDAGTNWTKFLGGLPTISFRDLAIQQRENDLIGASFGRSFYVLDDYSFLREVTQEKLDQEGALFASRKAYWYIPRAVIGGSPKASQGAAYYTAKNPDFGATFTYFLQEDLKTKAAVRKAAEKKKIKANQSVSFPGWEALEAEMRQQKPEIWLTVKNDQGEVIRRIKGATKKGMHRVAWALKYPASDAIKLNMKPYDDPENEPTGLMAAPGTYTVTLSKLVDGVVTELDGPVEFEVVPLREGTLPGASPDAVASFWQELSAFEKKMDALTTEMNNSEKRLKAMRVALANSVVEPGNLDKEMHEAMMKLYALDQRLNGSKAKNEVGEKNNPSIRDRFSAAAIGTTRSTYGPTPMHKRSMEIANETFNELLGEAKSLMNETIPSLEQSLKEAGAPWVEGQSLPIGTR
jgi:hypothetical protein